VSWGGAIESVKGTRESYEPQRHGRLPRLLGALVRLPVVTVVAAAIVVRLLAGVAFTAADTDVYEFGWLAENIVDGHGYTYFTDTPQGRVEPTRPDSTDRLASAFMPPGYTYLTAAGAAVGGSHDGTVWAVRALNALLAAAGVVLIDSLGRRLVGRPAARLAAVGFAFYPALVYAATQVSAANLYLPLEMGLLLLLIRAGRLPSWRRWAEAGLFLGALCLVRAEAVAVVPLATAWLLWTASKAGVTRQVGLRLGAVFVAAAAALPGAWLVRNSLVLGEPVATITTTAGLNLWYGNHDGASGSQKNIAVPERLRGEISRIDAGDAFELRRDEVFRREAFESMARDPIGTAWRDVKKAGLLLGADVNDRRNLNPFYLGSYAVLAALGVAGFVQWWRRRDPGDTVRWLVAGYLAFSVVVPVVFFALARFRLPIELLLLVFAGAWLSPRVPGAATAPPAGVPAVAAVPERVEAVGNLGRMVDVPQAGSEAPR